MKYILTFDEIDGYPCLWETVDNFPLTLSNCGRWFRDNDDTNITCVCFGSQPVESYGIDLTSFDNPNGKQYLVEVTAEVLKEL
jgi:hypothetical protein